MLSTVTDKGQVTLPKAIRDRLGILPGTRIDFEVLGADIVAIQPTYPFEQLVYFLIVVSVGGLGSLRGPFVAALLIGITDTACKYWVPEFGAFFIYAATIGLLLWRPMGLFGKRT